jgi:hypothetical protein
MTVYDDEEKAFRRVETMKKSGMWPGVRRAGTGCVVTFDPDDEPVPDLPSAPNSELGWERDRRDQREPDASRASAYPPKSAPAGVQRRLP